jgi:hypothetical protein
MLLIFVYMRTAKKKLAAKGDRLNWTLLKDVKPVRLSGLDIQGKVVVISKNEQKKTAKILVP